MTTKVAIVPTASRAKAEHTFEHLQKLMSNLYARWLDEREYEDIAEYGKAVERNLPEGVTFVKITKRPFGVHLKVDSLVFAIEINSTRYRLKYGE